MKKMFALFAVAALAACTDSDGAEHALTQLGLTDIQITGFRLFGCDEKDTFHTGFTATGQTGERVSGVVCSGLLKGNTVRFD